MEVSSAECLEVLDTIPGIVWEREAQSLRFSLVSAAAERILGYPASRWLEEPGFWSKLIHPDDRGAAIAALRAVANGEAAGELIYRVIAADGRTVWLQDRVARVGEGNTFLRGITVDVSAERRLIERLQVDASRDPLTGLYNRRVFMEWLQKLIETAARARHALAVLFLDLDDFKPVNDRLGHSAGDRVLQYVAETLLTSVRRSDLVGRVGGDEFAVALPGLEAPPAREIAHKLLDALLRPIEIEGTALTTPCSIGISLYPYDGTEAENLLREADAAMYRAKQARSSAARQSLGRSAETLSVPAHFTCIDQQP